MNLFGFVSLNKAVPERSALKQFLFIFYIFFMLLKLKQIGGEQRQR